MADGYVTPVNGCRLLGLVNSCLSRLLQLRVLITCLISFIWLSGFHHLFMTMQSLYNYKHIPTEVIHTQLYKQTVYKLVFPKSLPDCRYDEILASRVSISNVEIPKKFDNFSVKGLVKGSYMPESCKPLFSVAILVTYRNRQSQLDIFLPYMHNFLRKQNIHYRIYIIEQQDEKPFNRGLLHNIGAEQAIRHQFPCLILHDVDLLPLDESNLYACASEPRHMSASIDKFRFVLPYPEIVGGVLAIKSEQYTAINGFSNKFAAWGGEDDDFFTRLTSHKLDVLRFPREMSRYTMMVHQQQPKNSQRRRILNENENQLLGEQDGLNSLPYHHVQVKNYRLFTLIGVQL